MILVSIDLKRTWLASVRFAKCHRSSHTLERSGNPVMSNRFLLLSTQDRTLAFDNAALAYVLGKMFRT